MAYIWGAGAFVAIRDNVRMRVGRGAQSACFCERSGWQFRRSVIRLNRRERETLSERRDSYMMSKDEQELELEARIEAAVAKAFERQLPELVSRIEKKTPDPPKTDDGTPKSAGGGK